MKTIELGPESTVRELKTEISAKTELPSFDLKHGYPPKPLELDQFGDGVALADTGLKLDGEQLMAVPRHAEQSLKHPVKDPPREAPAPVSSATISSSQPTFAGRPNTNTAAQTAFDKDPPQDTPEVPLPSHESTVVLRVMPDDNSCLFRALGTAVLGPSLDSMHELRAIVAAHIQEDQKSYNAAVLDKDPADYCRWIQTDAAWGGAIELQILAQHFEIEICSINVQDGRVDRFNEGSEGRQRCILVYSGIHYDVIALSPSFPPHTRAHAPPDMDVKVFDRYDEDILEGAVLLVTELRKRHYFTDTAGFLLRCLECGWTGKGEKAAAEHAQETRHFQIEEFAG